MMNEKTIVALDFSTREDLFAFLSKFEEPIYVKIGMEPVSYTHLVVRRRAISAAITLWMNF